MANKFWVGGDGSWSQTAHWATTSGGAGSTGVPASGDVVTFDGNAGAGSSAGGGPVVTIDQNISLGTTTGKITLGTTGGAFAGTLDFTVGGPWTVTAGQFSFSGTGTRKILCGSTTFNLNLANANSWDLTTTTSLDGTSDFSSATINFGSNSAVDSQVFSGGGKSYGTLNIQSGHTGGGPVGIVGANTFANFTVTAPANIQFPLSVTNTITNAFTWTGSASSPINIFSSGNAIATIAATGGGTITWGILRDITFTTGTVTANNSLNMGTTAGVTITAPSTGGAIGVIGS